MAHKGNLRTANYDGVPGLMFFCPGCKHPHTITYGTGGWIFNGNFDKPTFNPSLLTLGTDENGKEEKCHMYVRDGIIEFLDDCTHKLKGQKVPIPELPDWMKD